MLNWRDPKNPMSGGAERVTLGYLAELAKRGHEAFWFTNEFPGGESEEEIDGVRIIRRGGIGSSILHARRWCKTQLPFDLVVDQHHGIPWFAPWWCGTQCVSFIHEVLGPIWNAFYPWPINVIGQFQERWTHWLYRRVPFWTACESTQKCLHANGVRNVTIIPYGVGTDALAELRPKPLEKPVRLIVVSRLAQNKRVDHSIRCVQVLIARKININLKIVGTGDMEEPLRKLANELDVAEYVHFTGHLSEREKEKTLQESHFLLHTSQREGWGLNVIEANAMGTPAIVYPVPGLIDSTLHDETGLVSKVETPESLAESLITALQSPDKYEEYRRKALSRSRTFHWSVVLPEACDWLEAQARSVSQSS